MFISRKFTAEAVEPWLQMVSAVITVLLICIQLKALSPGATLVAVGVGAAISLRQATKRWSGLNRPIGKAPYLSSALIAIVGVSMAIHGYAGLK